jgi:hypothetical protein
MTESDLRSEAVNTGRELRAVMVRYFDDFVVLCRKGRGAEIYRLLKSYADGMAENGFWGFRKLRGCC